jgi:hypothetical protein
MKKERERLCENWWWKPIIIARWKVGVLRR